MMSFPFPGGTEKPRINTAGSNSCRMLRGEKDIGPFKPPPRYRSTDTPDGDSFPQHAVPAIHGWPRRPQRIQLSQVTLLVSLVVDVPLTIVSLLFFVLSIAAVLLKDRPTTDSTAQFVSEATKLGPTVFPILFAALVGRALKHIARFKAERGIKISVLWPLMNCRTLFDTLTLQYSLRRASWVAFGLFFLWALSPVGGQASLRLLITTNSTTASNESLTYMDTGPMGHIFVMELTPALSSVVIAKQLNTSGFPLSINSAFQAALMQSNSAKVGAVDSWGNVKIPRFELLDPSLEEDERWIPLNGTITVDNYTALIGLPIVNTPQDGRVEFPLESSYVALENCTQVLNTSVDEDTHGLSYACPNCLQLNGDILDDTETQAAQSLYAVRAATFLGSPLSDLNSTGPAYFQKYQWNEGDEDPREIHFKSLGRLLENQSEGEQHCEVYQRHVENWVVCTDGACRVTHMRASLTDDRPPSYTPFDYWAFIALKGLTEVSTWNSTEHADTASPAQRYLKDSSALPVTGTKSLIQGLQERLDIASIPSDTFALRASALLNTYIQVMMAEVALAGDLPTLNMSIYGPGHIPAEGLTMNASAWENVAQRSWFPGRRIVPNFWLELAEEAPFIGATTTASVTTFKLVFRPNTVWVVVLGISSLALVALGIVGIYLSSRTIGPDVFDPVMGLTYTNPNLQLPTNGTVIGAADRARLLHDLEVKLGDVGAPGLIGRIGLGTREGTKGLVDQRMYYW
ncbi:hypothetical protein MKZ38_010686 [Zalerion maritima]|uniref:Uncharacterized protein n=1 Tax=Zalerion maritima TaxID=339359 RepID=A0AAD5WST9_9PEZI|nr:hypothetical protein MKZ38_010686 [Zalerion maritima]